MLRIDIRHKMFTNEGPRELRINTTVEKNEIMCLFGHSGSGKTTLLRIITGLTKPDSGKIEFNNVVWFDSEKKINVPPQKRNAGFMFQDYALFPHLSVENNIHFAQSQKDMDEVRRLMHLFDLLSLKKQKPAKLSGGQKQRVALARTLASSPVLLLLDEPLSALDYHMRNELQDAILTAHRELNTISIMVSHDVQEVKKMADKVLLLRNGEMVDQGTAEQVFRNIEI